MRCWSMLLALGLANWSAAQGAETFDWEPWRCLPVCEGGQVQPLDSLAREALKSLGRRTSWTDPDTKAPLEAHVLYLRLMFDWQGWEQTSQASPVGGTSSRTTYFQRHQPDRWDESPLLSVESAVLREAFGWPKQQRSAAPLEVSRAKLQPPETGTELPFVNWAETLQRKSRSARTPFEEAALELAERLWAYQEHRTGARLGILPRAGGSPSEWMTAAQLLRTVFNEDSDPTGRLRQLQGQLQTVRQAYRQGSAADFNARSTAFLTSVREFGPQLGEYPPAARLEWEVRYNGWAPFRIAWICLILAVCGWLLQGGAPDLPGGAGETGAGQNSSPSRFRAACGGLAWCAFAAGLLAAVSGFAWRIALTGRAPVTNLYESLLWVGLGTAVLGLCLELRYRRRHVVVMATMVAGAALCIADTAAPSLDSGLHPLPPVLHSNFWLSAHVLTITLSYAAFALAWGLGNALLGYYLAGAEAPRLRRLTDVGQQCLRVGLALLVSGTVLGSIWADRAWGQFWAWEPKQIGTLIAILGYAAILYARQAGWLQEFGLASWAVIGFLPVVAVWYGANFVFITGRHDFGYSTGGGLYVLAGIGLQLVYSGFATIRYIATRDERA